MARSTRTFAASFGLALNSIRLFHWFRTLNNTSKMPLVLVTSKRGFCARMLHRSVLPLRGSPLMKWMVLFTRSPLIAGWALFILHQYPPEISAAFHRRGCGPARHAERDPTRLAIIRHERRCGLPFVLRGQVGGECGCQVFCGRARNSKSHCRLHRHGIDRRNP